MVKISRIYTRTGDDGTTGLVGGKRIAKDAPRVEAYGDVDELNSHLGLIRTVCEEQKIEKLVAIVSQIQNELFDLGSELATPPGEKWEGMITVQESHSKQLESWIDELTAGIPELRSFVLPGGTQLNSFMHIARTVCRRAERSVLKLAREEDVSKDAKMYLNRLSDLLFAMARYESHRAKKPEYLWVPGKK